MAFVYRGQQKKIRARGKDNTHEGRSREHHEEKNSNKSQPGCHKHDPGYISSGSIGRFENLFNHGFYSAAVVFVERGKSIIL